VADRLARLEDVTARNPGRTLQQGFRISQVFSPLSQQRVATPSISPAKPTTSTTCRSVRTLAGGAGNGGNPGVYLLRVQTAAASVTQRVTLE